MDYLPLPEKKNFKVRVSNFLLFQLIHLGKEAQAEMMAKQYHSLRQGQGGKVGGLHTPRSKMVPIITFVVKL